MGPSAGSFDGSTAVAELEDSVGRIVLEELEVGSSTASLEVGYMSLLEPGTGLSAMEVPGALANVASALSSPQAVKAIAAAIPRMLILG
jgi:hypothetical protein